jgi:hypothetical protein
MGFPPERTLYTKASGVGALSGRRRRASLDCIVASILQRSLSADQVRVAAVVSAANTNGGPTAGMRGRR